MISVVVTSHNSEQYIRETLESVGAQTVGRHALDIVVVDSGSADGTCASSEQAAADLGLDVRLIQTTNRGPSHARNLGVRESAGEWIQFLDGDDLIHSEKIERQMAEAAIAAETDATVYSAWTRLHLRQGKWRAQEQLENPAISTEDPLLALLQAENFVQIGAQLFRRSWLGAVGAFDERLWLVEDVDLMLRLAAAGATFRQVQSEEPLLYYRQRPDSLSRRDLAGFADACTRNAELAESHWRGRDELTPERRSTLADVYRYASRFYALRDRQKFNAIAGHIESLVPEYVPNDPPRVRRASRLLGYRRAETLAAAWYRLRGV